MTEKYKEIMNEMGYNHLVCDIFDIWEDVKDEILLPDRKDGSGNGTVHVFLGNADNVLRNEFSTYYNDVKKNGDTNKGAVVINHYFLKSNIYSMIGAMCQYCYAKKIDFSRTVEKIFKEIENEPSNNGLLHTTSLFKLSIGSSKLRPYFKQFESDGIFHKVIRLLLVPKSAYKLYLLKNDNGDYAAFWLIGFNDLDDFEVNSIRENLLTNKKRTQYPFQQIYYGAPGTGKSNRIKKQLVEMNVPKGNIFRTTFHPDSDYSSFVGAYKPTMKKQYRYDGKIKAKYYEDDDLAGAKRDDAIIDKVIQYDFVPQTFIKAYIQAYKKPDENVYLIIEEINRGNCAQIFGDLFQLLDRDDNGKSQYPIKADSDLRMYLEEELGNHSDGIKDGELCLPSNLYIWATMNTSDQSLFPIDSAFKRRWDWEYVKIADAEKGWKIKCGSKYCDWWEFIKEINKKIAKETSSDDKKLGYFFCKPPKGSDEISEEKFVSKVLFYLWNDVFKDGDISLFKVSEVENAEICFDAFYNNDNTVNVNAIEKFLTSIVGDKHLMSSDDNQMPDEEGYDNENSSDYSKYSFDGKSALPKKELGYNIVLKYVNEHNDKTFAELQSDLTFDNTVDNRYRYNGILASTNNISDGYKRYFSSKELTSSDGVKYKILNGWNKYNIDFIIKFAEAQGWEVSKETE